MASLAQRLTARLPGISLAYAINWTLLALLIGVLIGLVTGAPDVRTAMDYRSAMASGSEHGQFAVAAAEAPTLALSVERDADHGWNVLLETGNFRFAPAALDQPARAGEGHAYLYVDGELWARLYSPDYHLGDLGPGLHLITVTLNANNHAGFAVDGVAISATVSISE